MPISTIGTASIHRKSRNYREVRLNGIYLVHFVDWPSQFIHSVHFVTENNIPRDLVLDIYLRDGYWADTDQVLCALGGQLGRFITRLGGILVQADACQLHGIYMERQCLLALVTRCEEPMGIFVGVQSEEKGVMKRVLEDTTDYRGTGER